MKISKGFKQIGSLSEQCLFDSYKTWENIAFKTLYSERSPNISKLKIGDREA